MRKDRQELCVTALEWRLEWGRRPAQPKTKQKRMTEKERHAVGRQLWTFYRALAIKLKWVERDCHRLLCLITRRDVYI